MTLLARIKSQVAMGGFRLGMVSRIGNIGQSKPVTGVCRPLRAIRQRCRSRQTAQPSRITPTHQSHENPDSGVAENPLDSRDLLERGPAPYRHGSEASCMAA